MKDAFSLASRYQLSFVYAGHAQSEQGRLSGASKMAPSESRPQQE